jgi:gliding motility-associated-like protein
MCKDGSVQLHASGGDEYAWTPASLTCIDCADPVAHPLATTMYYVTVRDTPSGCQVVDSVQVFVDSMNITPYFADTLIDAGESAILGVDITGGGGFFSYLWTPGQFLNDSTAMNPVATPTIDITYQVLVSDGVCSDTTSMMIHLNTELLVEVPTGFTPNGDSKNDLFYPVFLNNSGTVTTFHVYNRFGQLIHNSTEPWDGKFKGIEQPTGTFVYYIRIKMKNDEQKDFHGSVTLVR